MSHSKWEWMKDRNPGGNREYHILQELKGFVSETSLVNPLNSTVLCLQIYVCRSSIEHGGNLALDVCLESLSELYY